MRAAIHLVFRSSLVTLLLVAPGGVGFRVDSSLTISNLTIAPTSGSASFRTPLSTSATTHASLHIADIN